MGSSLSENLTKYDPLQEPFSAYITFINDDGCKIYVPVPFESSKELLAKPEALLINEINRKMDEDFIDTAPEYGPLLMPNSEFALKVRTHPRYKTLATLTPTRSSGRLRSSQGSKESSAAAKRSDFIEVEGEHKTFDLSNSKELVEAFISRRNEMRFGQRDVAYSLKLLYDIDRSGSFIHRFETMGLSVSNFVEVCPVIRQWLRDTETIDSRAAIIRATVNRDLSVSLMKTGSTVSNPPVSLHKRRKRTTLTAETKEFLEEHFMKDPLPSRSTIKQLSTELGMETDVIRVWFCNRRQKKTMSGR